MSPLCRQDLHLKGNVASVRGTLHPYGAAPHQAEGRSHTNYEEEVGTVLQSHKVTRRECHSPTSSNVHVQLVHCVTRHCISRCLSSPHPHPHPLPSVVQVLFVMHGTLHFAPGMPQIRRYLWT